MKQLMFHVLIDDSPQFFRSPPYSQLVTLDVWRPNITRVCHSGPWHTTDKIGR